MGVRVSSSSLFSLYSFAVFYFAEIAQLVEHNLAKVGVASSSLVFRSVLIEGSFRDIFSRELLFFLNRSALLNDLLEGLE